MFKPVVFAIFVLLGQAGQDVFLIDADQLIEIADSKQSKKELKILTKAYKKAKNEYEYIRRSQAESFADAQYRRGTTAGELRSLLTAQKNERMTYLSVLLDLRVQIQAVPDSAEWSRYINHSYTAIKTPEPTQISSQLLSTERIAALKKVMEKTFSGSKYETKARDIMDDFIQDLVEITQNEADRRKATEYILVDKNASRTQLQKVLEDRYLFYQELADAFVQFRTRILQIVEPEDWADIALKLSKLVYD